METVRVNPDRCDGCGDCLQVCPVECISLDDGIACVGPDCFVCLACAVACHQDAIIEPQRREMPARLQRPKGLEFGRGWGAGGRRRSTG